MSVFISISRVFSFHSSNFNDCCSLSRSTFLPEIEVPIAETVSSYKQPIFSALILGIHPLVLLPIAVSLLQSSINSISDKRREEICSAVDVAVITWRSWLGRCGSFILLTPMKHDFLLLELDLIYLYQTYGFHQRKGKCHRSVIDCAIVPWHIYHLSVQSSWDSLNDSLQMSDRATR